MSTKEINPSLNKFQKRMKYYPTKRPEVPTIPQEFLGKDSQGWEKKHNKEVIPMKNTVMCTPICHLRKENNLPENHVQDLEKLFYM